MDEDKVMGVVVGLCTAMITVLGIVTPVVLVFAEPSTVERLLASIAVAVCWSWSLVMIGGPLGQFTGELSNE